MNNAKVKRFRLAAKWQFSRTAAQVLGKKYPRLNSATKLKQLADEDVLNRGIHWQKANTALWYDTRQIVKDLKKGWLDARIKTRDSLGHAAWMRAHFGSQDYAGFLAG